MREIKFRLWLPHEKRMTYAFDITEMPDKTQVHKGVIYLQFTGLKDKNGKEIYEGDIVKKNGIGEMTGRPPSVKMVGSIKKVIFNEGGFCLTSSLASKKYFLKSNLIRYYALEIIGNIYEHPHLLSKEQNAHGSVATEDHSSTDAGNKTSNCSLDKTKEK